MIMSAVQTRPIAPSLLADEELALHFKPFQFQDETNMGKHHEQLSDDQGKTRFFILSQCPRFFTQSGWLEPSCTIGAETTVH